jgi:hypothetical protein
MISRSTATRPPYGKYATALALAVRVAIHGIESPKYSSRIDRILSNECTVALFFGGGGFKVRQLCQIFLDENHPLHGILVFIYKICPSRGHAHYPAGPSFPPASSTDDEDSPAGDPPLDHWKCCAAPEFAHPTVASVSLGSFAGRKIDS